MKTTLLKTILLLLMMAGMVSCGKDEPTELAGTKWKLAGFVDAMTDILTVPQPENCKECYTLTFDTEYTAIAHSITLNVPFDLRDLNPNRMITFIGESHSHGFDFRVGIGTAGSFTLIADELKLFYNDNKNYLFFKRIK